MAVGALIPNYPSGAMASLHSNWLDNYWALHGRVVCRLVGWLVAWSDLGWRGGNEERRVVSWESWEGIGLGIRLSISIERLDGPDKVAARPEDEEEESLLRGDKKLLHVLHHQQQQQEAKEEPGGRRAEEEERGKYFICNRSNARLLKVKKEPPEDEEEDEEGENMVKRSPSRESVPFSMDSHWNIVRICTTTISFEFNRIGGGGVLTMYELDRVNKNPYPLSSVCWGMGCLCGPASQQFPGEGCRPVEQNEKLM